MLQAVVARSVGASRAAARSATVARGSSKTVANGKVSVSRRVSAVTLSGSVCNMHQSMKLYSSKVPAAPGDQEHVWEDLDGIQDFYDPRWDTDMPEEEGMFEYI